MMTLAAAPTHCTLNPSESARGQAAVRLAGVSKVFGQFVAVRNVSLELQPNTITVLLGENGAGKSTLLRLLAGLAAPTHGSLTVFGQKPSALRGSIAYMSHAPMLYDELSAPENLAYFASLHRIGDDCGCAASPEMALRAVSLDPHLQRSVGQFSQGMRQRASLARVLQTDPELLLLDEPFSNLDVESAKHVVDLIADFKTWPSPRGRTIVLTTHQAHLAAEIADLTLTMRGGAVINAVHRRETT